VAAYYNEIDPFAAAWLRELMREGVIADGEVDERSIAQVQPGDLAGFTGCHWFAGIGAWSYALRCAEFSDDRPVWTGSCPCPSFSAAGKGQGFSDPRHLWPDWFRLIRKCRPATIFGEQVNAAIGHGWLDLVQTDLEAADYAVGKAVLGACSVGAPHIRQRLYFVGESYGARSQPRRETGAPLGHGSTAVAAGGAGTVAQSCSEQEYAATAQRLHAESSERSAAGELGNAKSERIDGISHSGEITRYATEQERRQLGGPGFTNGFWRDAIWLPCRDGKARPAKSSIFPLASGIANRVGLLRGAGNALTAPVAQAFIEAYLDLRRRRQCPNRHRS